MKQIGKYEIVEKIGGGGFGEVFKAYDPLIQRYVAIKTCTSEDSETRQRFFREAQIAGNLHHKNITTIYDFGLEDELPYLIQEYLSGEDLDNKIRRGGPVSYEEKLRILIQIVTGLAHAHGAGVIHRDVKPANVRILEDGSVKILDFGIAKLAQQETRLTKTGMTLGTAAYLAPEQIRGDPVSPRTDVFSFGVLSYELLAGERPYTGDEISTIIYQILYQESKSIRDAWPQAPPELVAVVDRCMAREPEDRFADAGEVLRDLERLAAAGIGPATDEAASLVTLSLPTVPVHPRPPSTPTPSTPTPSTPTPRTPTPSSGQRFDEVELSSTPRREVPLTRPATRSRRAPWGAAAAVAVVAAGCLAALWMWRFDLASWRGTAAVAGPEAARGDAPAGESPGEQTLSDEDPSRAAPSDTTSNDAVGGDAVEGAPPSTSPPSTPAAPPPAKPVMPEVTVPPPPPPLRLGTLIVPRAPTDRLFLRLGDQTYPLGQERRLRLEPGAYTASFELLQEGYEARQEIAFEIVGGETLRLELPDLRAPGELRVRALPGSPQGRVLIDGQELATSPVEERLPPGRYRIRIEPLAGDTAPLEDTVKVESNTVSILTFNLVSGLLLQAEKAPDPL